MKIRVVQKNICVLGKSVSKNQLHAKAIENISKASFCCFFFHCNNSLIILRLIFIIVTFCNIYVTNIVTFCISKGAKTVTFCINKDARIVTFCIMVSCILLYAILSPNYLCTFIPIGVPAAAIYVNYGMGLGQQK